MNANYHYYYSVIKKISSLSGHWPYQKSMKNLINVVLITLGVISIVIPQIAKSVKCNGSMECIFETTTAHVLSFLILVKLYACYFNRCKMKIIIDQLVNDWNELETPQEYEIMTRYAKNTRRYIIVYFGKNKPCDFHLYIVIFFFFIIFMSLKLRYLICA
ncbi:hypothetical protein PUN28_015215 [Cardiocondyla obscurior]|uniref:Uncharacterized protein n=1 Tax=Cardiocondyla obscurior TaxID=286306 RepID=A0AAW2F2T2_9HYME